MAKIKPYVEELLTTVLFVDIDTGRGIGYDYRSIVDLVKARFPKSRVSARNLRDWYTFNMQSEGKRLPVRRRSRRLLARAYTRALIMRQKNGIGVTFRHIQRVVHNLFPEVVSHSVAREAAHMEREGFALPPRPPFSVAEID